MENQQPVITTQPNQNKTILTMVVFLAFLIVIFIVIGLFSKKNPKLTETGNNLSPTQTITEKGSLILKTKDNKTSYSLNETITLVVYADSNQKPITGYDVVLNYDQGLALYKGKTNLEERYQVFDQAKANKIFLTGVKNPIIKDLIVLTNTPIVELSFQPQKAGNINFNLDFQPGSKTDSNLIDNANQEVLGKAEGLTLTVK